LKRSPGPTLGTPTAILIAVTFVRPCVSLALVLIPSTAAAQLSSASSPLSRSGAIQAAIVQQPTPSPPRSAGLTIDQAVSQAIEHNLALLADRFNLTVADARLVTARLRPNPSVRTDFLLERGAKRARRIDVAENTETVARLQPQNSIRQLTVDVQNACADVLLAKELRHRSVRTQPQ
jgi:hypothetical protein